MLLRAPVSFRLRLLACGPVVTMLLAGSLAVLAGERQRTKVLFSDSKAPSLLPEAATQSPLLSKSPGLFEPGDSLGGVAAPPFGSPSVGPGTLLPLPDRNTLERDRNWLQRSMDSISITDESAAKAFGVRDYGAKSAALTVPKHDGRWSGIVEDKEGDKERTTPAAPREENRWKEFSPAAAGNRPLLSGVNSSASEVRNEGPVVERNAVFFSDADSLDRAGSGTAEGIREAKRSDLLHGALNPADLLEALRGGARSSLNRNPQVRQDEFRRLLGLDPMASLPAPAGGASDAINVQPDLTRQEINPVVGRPAAAAKAADLPSFAATPPSAGGIANRFRPAAFETLPSRAHAPARSDSVDLPAADQHKRLFSPTTLPVPKRTI